MTNNKPQTEQELQQDLRNHPDRGKILNQDVVRFDSETLQLSIPKELYGLLLEIGGTMGLSKREIFLVALTRFASDVNNLALVERSQLVKAEKFGVSITEIRSKVFGAYKRVGREKAGRIFKGLQPSGD